MIDYKFTIIAKIDLFKRELYEYNTCIRRELKGLLFITLKAHEREIIVA